jgi:hypothetical protein
LCQIAPGFGSSARRIEGYISRYVAFNATEADGPKTKQDGAIIFFRGPWMPFIFAGLWINRECAKQSHHLWYDICLCEEYVFFCSL